MSKFEVMAHGEVSRYSAVDVRLALQSYILSQGELKSIHLFDSHVMMLKPKNNQNEPLAHWTLQKIVVNDAAFLIRFPMTQYDCLQVHDVISALQTLDRQNDMPLIIVDLCTKRLHQVADHQSVGYEIKGRTIQKGTFTLVVDQGDPMSDELVEMWKSFKVSE